MKKLLTLTLLSLFAITGSMRAADGWLTDPEQALATAKGTKKLVLLDFTGSDWCGWCIRLNKEVFSQPEFQAFAKENLVLVELDFPRRKPQPAAERARNEALAQKFKVEGYPTIVVLDGNGKKVGELGYMEGGPAAFIAALKKLLTS